MATAAGTIYFGDKCAQTTPRALQTSVHELSIAVNDVFWKALDTKASIRRADTAGSGHMVAFGAPQSLAVWRVVSPNRSRFSLCKA